MRPVTHLITAVTSACLIAIAVVALPGAQSSASKGEWRYFGGDRAHTRYSALDRNQREQRGVPAYRVAKASLQRESEGRVPRSDG